MQKVMSKTRANIFMKDNNIKVKKGFIIKTTLILSVVESESIFEYFPAYSRNVIKSNFYITKVVSKISCDHFLNENKNGGSFSSHNFF